MIKQIKTTWRPLLRLTEVVIDKDTGAVTETGNEFHLNVLNVPLIMSNPQWTALIYDLVKESAEDMYKAVDKMVKEEQERKAKEAEEYMKATQARVAETAAKNIPINDGGAA